MSDLAPSDPASSDLAINELGGDDLAQIYDGSPCGMCSVRMDGTIVAANQTLLSWVGRDRTDVVGTTRVDELLTVGGRIFWETHLAPVLQADGCLDEIAVELLGPRGRMPILLSARTRTGDGGLPDLIRIVMASSAERRSFEQELIRARRKAERSEDQLRTLQRITVALSEASGVDGVVHTLLNAVVTELGGIAATVRTGPDESVELSASASGATLSLPVRPGAGHSIILHGQSGICGRLDALIPGEEENERVDLEMLAAVGQQAGLALERARLFETNARIARTLQRSLLSVDTPVDPRYSFARAYRPGTDGLEVGGDWYDVFCTGEHILGFVVGDVVGRGLSAANAMGQLRSAVRAVSGPEVGPAQLFSQLDRFVEQVEAASSATLVYGDLDLCTGRLTYACAGHPPPVLLPNTGEPRLLWAGRSTPLGIPLDRSEAHEQLCPGDRVLLYTDGLIERRKRVIDDSLDLLCATAGSLRRLPCEELVATLMSTMLRDAGQPDDVCVLLVRWDGPVTPS